MTTAFNKNLLPIAGEFYATQLPHLKPKRNGWATALCCFHPDKNPSLSVNLESGAFNCFSCGARGGDVLDFYRKRHNVDFRTAAQALGAIGDMPADYQPAKADRARQAVREFRRWEVSCLTHVCRELQLIWRFMADCKDMDEVVKLAKLYHRLPTLEMYFEILSFGDDESKYLLFREVADGI